MHALPHAQSRAPWECLRSYIDEHMGRPISVAEMAHRIGYSPNYFTRLFRQSFRKSPHQYVIERRIDRRASCCWTPRGPSSECGFAATQAHLSSAFKRRLGLTPGEFRAGRA